MHHHTLTYILVQTRTGTSTSTLTDHTWTRIKTCVVVYEYVSAFGCIDTLNTDTGVRKPPHTYTKYTHRCTLWTMVQGLRRRRPTRRGVGDDDTPPRRHTFRRILSGERRRVGGRGGDVNRPLLDRRKSRPSFCPNMSNRTGYVKGFERPRVGLRNIFPSTPYRIVLPPLRRTPRVLGTRFGVLIYPRSQST